MTLLVMMRSRNLGELKNSRLLSVESPSIARGSAFERYSIMWESGSVIQTGKREIGR
jgi:hypothetical protein